MSPVALGNGTLPRGHSTSPRVMIPATRAFHQTARSSAHAFRSQRLRPLLMVCKYCRIRANYLGQPVMIAKIPSPPRLGGQLRLESEGSERGPVGLLRDSY